MANYEKLEDELKPLTSASLLGDGENEERKSSSDSSTIIARSSWMDSCQYNRGLVSLRALVALCTGLMLMFCAIIFFLGWIIVELRDVDHSELVVSQDKALSTGFSSCGTSSAEAILAGCYFDIFSFGWFSPECTDLQAYNDSIQVFSTQIAGDPPFFLRTNDDSPLDHEPISLLEIEEYACGKQPAGIMHDNQEVLGTWEHYLVACAYSWQKLQRAAMRNWPLDEWSTSYALANHCGQDLLHREKKESGSVMWHMKPWFPKCGLDAEDLKTEIMAALNH